MRTRAALATLCLVPLGAASLPAAAAEDPPAREEAAGQDYGYALAREIMSPFCPGSTLADCTSSQAQTLRAWILVQAAAGRPRDEVFEELLARYGEQIRSAPRASGFGLAAWAIPVGVFLAGGGIVWLFLRRQTGQARGAPRARPAPLPAELERLVDEELLR
jgi:cytochrome c-type biogenesis protein CcmH/NrfF